MSWRRRVGEKLRDESGAALAEYGLLLAGITLVSLVAVSVLGTKVGGLVASVASLLPGAQQQQNGTVVVGELMETRSLDANGDGINEITIDSTGIAHDGSDTFRLGENLGMDNHDSTHLYQVGSRRSVFDE